ncbi:5'-nucleotidase [Porphyridium purpureum]|uniref:5'-nucleotidase n=1 Tax=Porphyridium purpureum TaxID=35688 RepID=A0A5J4YYZ8_PORPP|nr:5'-nucleotidase [Porphyridium purpureum]|eukprot:POR6128..scf208_2
MDPAVAERLAARTQDELTILHFNDVYEIEERAQEPVGGAARFASVVRRYERGCQVHAQDGAPQPLVLFSGDCFHPSMMSTVMGGEQMVPVLNALNVRAAVIGNHDLDRGVAHLEDLMRECSFPWLISNVREKKKARALANGLESLVVHWGTWEIGVLGIVENDWLCTLGQVDVEDLAFEDPIACVRRLAPEMRATHRLDLVIALTHMRENNDVAFAKQASAEGLVDLVLGGHDHHYVVRKVDDVYVCKSGTDFRDLTAIKVVREDARVCVVETAHEQITSDVPVDGSMQQIVDSYSAKIRAEVQKEIGFIDVDMDARFSEIRTAETNAGNFVMDILRFGVYPVADIAFVNAGTLRADVVFPRGPFRITDLLRLLPMLDETVVVEMPGFAVVEAMENSVSKYPSLEGRFAQVSGMRFEFDPEKPPGARVVPGSVFVGDEPLREDAMYRVITKQYMMENKDGYSFSKHSKVLVDSECAPMLPTLMRNYFKLVEVANAIASMRANKRDNVRNALLAWRDKAALSAQGGGGNGIDNDDDSDDESDTDGTSIKLKRYSSCRMTQNKYTIAPQLEGRIVNIRAPKRKVINP